MESLARAARKYQQAGLEDVLRSGLDVGYRKCILKKFVSPKLVARSRRPIYDTNTLQRWSQSEGRQWNVPTVDSRPSIPLKEATSDSAGFATLDVRTPPEPFVCEIPNGQLWPAAGLGITNDGAFIGDTISFQWNLDNRLVTALSLCLAENGLRSTSQRVLDKNIRLPRDAPAVDAICPLVPLWDNYYHWTTESLLKLMGVERYEAETGIEPTLLLPLNPSSWMTDSLELLGFGSERWLQTDAPVLRAERLVVPSFPDPSPEECAWLQRRAYDRVNVNATDPGRRVYVSRANATRRRVVNEDDVLDALEPYGFESYRLEELPSVRSQIELFAEAELVVSPHGAGLTNLLYSNETTVLELFGDWVKSTFYRIARLKDLNYEYLRCDGHGIDIHVDVNELRSAVECVLAESA